MANESIQNIKDIGNKSLGKKLKNRELGRMKGAFVGGILGVVVAVASRQSPYLFGLAGLVIGRVLLKN